MKVSYVQYNITLKALYLFGSIGSLLGTARRTICDSWSQTYIKPMQGKFLIRWTTSLAWNSLIFFFILGPNQDVFSSCFLICARIAPLLYVLLRILTWFCLKSRQVPYLLCYISSPLKHLIDYRHSWKNLQLNLISMAQLHDWTQIIWTVESSWVGPDYEHQLSYSRKGQAKSLYTPPLLKNPTAYAHPYHILSRKIA